MKSSNGELNRIGTFVFVFSCSLLVQDLNYVFTT